MHEAPNFTLRRKACQTGWTTDLALLQADDTTTQSMMADRLDSSGNDPSRTSLGFRWYLRIPNGHDFITSATLEGTEACFLSILFQAYNGQGHLRELPGPVLVGAISWLAALNFVEGRMYVWGSLQLDSGVDAKSVVGSPLPLTSTSVSCTLV